jgi:hypothetical protein
LDYLIGLGIFSFLFVYLFKYLNQKRDSHLDRQDLMQSPKTDIKSEVEEFSHFEPVVESPTLPDSLDISTRIGKLLVLKAFYLGRKFSASLNREKAVAMCEKAISDLNDKEQCVDTVLRGLFYRLILAEANRDFQSFSSRQFALDFANEHGLMDVFSDYLKVVEATQTISRAKGMADTGFVSNDGFKERVQETRVIGFDLVSTSYDVAQRAINFEDLTKSEQHFLFEKSLPEIMKFHGVLSPQH